MCYLLIIELNKGQIMEKEIKAELKPIVLSILKFFIKHLPKDFNEFEISELKLEYCLRSSNFPYTKSYVALNLLDVLTSEQTLPELKVEQIQSPSQLLNS